MTRRLTKADLNANRRTCQTSNSSSALKDSYDLLLDSLAFFIDALEGSDSTKSTLIIRFLRTGTSSTESAVGSEELKGYLIERFDGKSYIETTVDTSSDYETLVGSFVLLRSDLE